MHGPRTAFSAITRPYLCTETRHSSFLPRRLHVRGGTVALLVHELDKDTYVHHVRGITLHEFRCLCTLVPAYLVFVRPGGDKFRIATMRTRRSQFIQYRGVQIKQPKVRQSPRSSAATETISGVSNALHRVLNGSSGSMDVSRHEARDLRPLMGTPSDGPLRHI